MLDLAAMRRRVMKATAGGVAIAALAIACGSSSVPTPAYTKQPTSALEQVPYPPPPARVEQVPERPVKNAVWIDGEWTWAGRAYAWKRGRWIVPPANARFAPWTATRDVQGTMYVAAGAWRDDRGNEVPEPPPVLVEGGTGRSIGGAVVDPVGEQVTIAPNLPVGEPMPPVTDGGEAGATGATGGEAATASGAGSGASPDMGPDGGLVPDVVEIDATFHMDASPLRMDASP